MPKGQNSGGRIAPDGRTPQRPGVGRQSKRHDLERRDVPFLHGSDLQQGDVQAMESGQKVTRKRTQQPAGPGGATGSTAASKPARGGSSPSPGTPDPMQFLIDRTKGSMTPGQPSVPQRQVDVSAWTPLVQRFANAPGTSGVLRQAFLHQYAALARRPYATDVMVIDLQALEAGAEAMLDAEG